MLVSGAINFQIFDVHPKWRWDDKSMQLYGSAIPPHHYTVGRFKLVDAVFSLEHRSVPGSPQKLLLLLGRQARSRREQPEPWCCLVGVHERGLDLATFAADYGKRKSGREDGESIFQDDDFLSVGYAVRAVVRVKEISGIFHYVVSVKCDRSSSSSNDGFIFES